MADCSTVQAELTEARAALSAALKGEYSFDSGQGRQSVKRPAIGDLREYIADLEDVASACADNDTLITGSFQRHG
jgi:hypothetical protein